MAAHSAALINERRALIHAIYSDIIECMIGCVYVCVCVCVCSIDNVKRSIAPSRTKDGLRLCH